MTRWLAIAALLGTLVLAGCSLPSFESDTSRTETVTPPPTTTMTRSTSPPTTAPTAVVAPPSSVVESPQSGQNVSRTYKWSYSGKEWTWDLMLPGSLYEYFKGVPRPPTPNYSVYVTHPLDDPYLEGLVSKLRDAAAREGYSEYQTIAFAAAFVQSLPYATDDVSTGYDEYPRYPIETLVDNGGDCEDTAILMAALIRDLGYGVVLLSLPHHMAVGVAGDEGVHGTYWELSGTKYYYLETTGENWGIGEIPDDYKAARATIYEMKPVPILTHTWTSSGGVGTTELHVEVTNLGSAAAEGVYIFAGFDAGNEQVWNSQRSQEFRIGVDEKVTVTMTLKIPHGQHTRILVQIVYGGYAVDDSYSEWFDT